MNHASRAACVVPVLPATCHPGKLRPCAGAFGHHTLHHPGQLFGGLVVDHPLTDARLCDHHRRFIAQQFQFGQPIRFHGRAAVQDTGISARHLDQRAFRRAQRQRRALRQIAFDTELAGDRAHVVQPATSATFTAGMFNEFFSASASVTRP